MLKSFGLVLQYIYELFEATK